MHAPASSVESSPRKAAGVKGGRWAGAGMLTAEEIEQCRQAFVSFDKDGARCRPTPPPPPPSLPSPAPQPSMVARGRGHPPCLEACRRGPARPEGWAHTRWSRGGDLTRGRLRFGRGGRHKRDLCGWLFPNLLLPGLYLRGSAGTTSDECLVSAFSAGSGTIDAME